MNRKPGGFTLIELLVVISIIGILISAAAASYSVAQTKGRDGKRKADLKGIQQALEQYYQTNGKYPDTNGGKMKCNTTTDTTTTTDWGGTFICGGITTYMKPVPKDPAFNSASGFDYYYDNPTPSTYILSATIENKNDPENTANPSYVSGTLPCTPATSRTYCVINP